MDSATVTTIVSNTPSYDIRSEKVQALADTARTHLGVGSHELSITFVESQEIQDLNREYRGKDQPTDVLSFPQIEFPEPLTFLAAPPATKRRRGPPLALGDIVISLPEAAANAAKIGQGLDREVAFLIVHGLLHLCGHDHMEAAEEARMLREQEQLMARLAVDPNGPMWADCVNERKVS